MDMPMNMPGMMMSPPSTGTAAAPPPPGVNMNNNMNMGGMNMGGGSSMQMTLYWGPNSSFLIYQWTTSSVGPYVASLIACFFFAFVYEVLVLLAMRTVAWSRARHGRRRGLIPGDKNGSELSHNPNLQGNGASDAVVVPIEDSMPRSPPPFTMWMTDIPILERLLISTLLGLTIAVGYLNMLLIMTYNIGVFIAVVLGHTVGIFTLGVPSLVTALEGGRHCP